MSWNLRDRLAVVTGAGGGLGRAIAEALANVGCRVVAIDIDAAGLAETRERIAERGSVVDTFDVDVANREAIFALAEDVDALGGADILVNNAGVTVLSDFEDHSIEDFEWLMGVNFWGVVYGCKAFLPQLMDKDRAHIVNISSVFGIVGMPSQSSYCASKFAVRGLSESLRAELADRNVGVTSVHPGGIRTKIAESARASGANYQRQKARSVRFFAEKTMPADQAAPAIVRAIRRNQSRLVITPEAHALDVAQRVWPQALGRVVRWGRQRIRRTD